MDIKTVDSPAMQWLSVDFAMWQNALNVHYLAAAMMLYVYYGRHNKHGHVDHDESPSHVVRALAFPNTLIVYYGPHNIVGQTDQI